MTDQPDELQDVATGITAVSAALSALADGDERAALDQINRLANGEVHQAAAYLLSALHELVDERAKRDRRRLVRDLRHLAANAQQDITDTQIRLMTRDIHPG